MKTLDHLEQTLAQYTEFEKGTVAGFTWNVDSDVEIESVANLPNAFPSRIDNMARLQLLIIG